MIVEFKSVQEFESVHLSVPSVVGLGSAGDNRSSGVVESGASEVVEN